MTAIETLPEMPRGQESTSKCAPDYHGARLVYLVFDSNDSRVLHRARTLEANGVDLILAGFHRDRTPILGTGNWESVDLGQTIDEDYSDRMVSMVRAGFILWRNRAALKLSRGIISRNIEQLLLARLIQLIIRKRIPIAYECLDIHHLMVNKGIVSSVFRALERWCLRSCDLLIVSSPAYIDHYFRPTQGFKGNWQLIENKLAPRFVQSIRPPKRAAPRNRPLTIGWFGILRCAKSFDYLTRIAAARPDDVRIVIRGVLSGISLSEFRERIAGLDNVEFLGPYKNPDDLGTIYEDIDLTWAIDYFEEGGCSEWLLPNRMYESGFYSVPMLTRAGTATGDYVTDAGIGWAVPEPLESGVVSFLDQLDADEYERVSDQIAQLPITAWVESNDAPSLLARLLNESVPRFSATGMKLPAFSHDIRQGD